MLLKKYSFVVFIVIANLILLFAQVPIIIRFLRSPPWAIYPLINADYIYDFNVYLSAIRQGVEGSWLFVNQFTSEPQPSSIMYIFYVIAGRLMAPWHMWLPLVYHVAKFYAAELFIVSIYFTGIMFAGPVTGFLGAVLAVAAPFAPLSFFGEPKAFIDYNPWWDTFTPWNRLDRLPHYMFATALALMSVVFFGLFVEEKNNRYLIPVCLLAVVAAVQLPTSMFPLLIGYAGAGFFQLYRTRKIPDFMKLGYWVVTAAVGFALLLVVWQTGHDPIWVAYKVWEITQWNKYPNLPITIFMLLGALSVIGIPAMLYSVQRGTWKLLFVAIWAVIPFLMLPFMNLLGMGKIRVLYEAPFVPWGILAAITVVDLRPKHRAWRLLWISACAGIFLYTGSSAVAIYRHELMQAQTEELWGNLYIPRDVFNAMAFVNNTIPNGSSFISDVIMGNIIAAYTPLRSFVGHTGQTYNYQQKNALVGYFFGGTMPAGDAALLLRQIQVPYVIYWKQLTSPAMPAYPFLTRIYDNDAVSIYGMSADLPPQNNR